MSVAILKVLKRLGSLLGSFNGPNSLWLDLSFGIVLSDFTVPLLTPLASGAAPSWLYNSRKMSILSYG